MTQIQHLLQTENICTLAYVLPKEPFELTLNIISFSTAQIQFTDDQISIISKAQNLIKLSFVSLGQTVSELSITVNTTKINLFTSYKSKVQTVSSILTSISNNSNVNATTITKEQTAMLVQVIANGTIVLQALGKT